MPRGRRRLIAAAALGAALAGLSLPRAGLWAFGWIGLVPLFLAANGARTLDMTAGQLMTRAVQVAHPDTTVEQAMQMMTAGRFRHLPVIDHDALIGLISIGDVVKARIMHQDSVVESLTAYVAGSA